MHPIIVFFGSGVSLLVGALLLLALVIVRWRWRFWLWVVDILAIVGMLCIGLAGTPIPALCIQLMVALGLAWLILMHCRGVWKDRARWFGAAMMVVVAAIICPELPYLATPRAARPPEAFYVVGDSITAGIGGDRWPDLVTAQYKVAASNLAVGGATARSAYTQVAKIPEDGRLILVEIGGNDMFGQTPPEQFGADLDALLTRIASHPVIMFELPLYPWMRDYGVVQRQVAARHGIRMIPKRRMAWIFCGSDATVDGLHLSRLGAQRMADLVADVLRLGTVR